MGKRLGVEQIDLYQIHMPDVVQPGRFFGFVENKDEEYWEGLARCVELGLVREIGVSNYGPTLLKRCSAFMAKRGLKFASNQIHYSLLARNKGNNQATVDAANELGIKTLAYYPLAMGLLTDKGDQRTGALEHYATDEERRRLEDAADALGFEFQGTFAKRVDGKFVGYGVEEWRLD